MDGGERDKEEGPTEKIRNVEEEYEVNMLDILVQKN